MHELGIAQNLVGIIEEQREQHEFTQVEKVRIKVGELTLVVPEALQFAFKVAAQGTVAEGAELVIEEVPLIVRCGRCGKESKVRPFEIHCPHCKELSVEIVSGTELQIISLEVDDGRDQDS